MVVIGIDVGVTGALAAVDSRGTCSVEDLPTMALEGKRLVKRRIDARGLMELIRRFVPPGESAVALIEDVHMRPGNGGAATASLLHSRGVIEAVLELARLDVHAVQPSTWKRFYGLLGTEKAASLVQARTLYPLAQGHLKLQKHHNRAESLLIAHYGLRTLA